MIDRVDVAMTEGTCRRSILTVFVHAQRDRKAILKGHLNGSARGSSKRIWKWCSNGKQ